LPITPFATFPGSDSFEYKYGLAYGSRFLLTYVFLIAQFLISLLAVHLSYKLFFKNSQQKVLLIVTVVSLILLSFFVIKPEYCQAMLIDGGSWYVPNSSLWYFIPWDCDTGSEIFWVQYGAPITTASADTVVITPETIDLDFGEEKEVKVAFFNPTISTVYWTVGLFDDQGKCGGVSESDKCFDRIDFIYDDSMFVLKKDDTKGMYINIKPDNNAVKTGELSNIYMVRVKFCGKSDGTEISDCNEADIIHEKQFVMTVRR